MIQTTPRTADFIMSQSRTFKAAMHFEDGSGVKITATIVSFDVSMTIPEDDILPGMVLSSQANITVAEDINTGVGNDLEGKHFQLYLIPDIYANGTTYGDLRTYTHADLSSFTHGEIRTLTGEPIPMGRYKVTSCKVTGGKTSIEAHDDLYGADRALTSESHTVADIEQDICNALGIKGRRTSAIDSMPIAALPEECTCREMLGLIAALDGGKAAYIDREGYLCHKDMTSTGYTVSRSRSAEPEAEKKAITVTGVCCKVDDDPTHDKTAGTTPRMIIISNPYMTDQIFGQIAAKFVGLTYNPLNVKYLLGDPRLELLDIVEVQRGSNSSLTVPITALTYSFDGGLSCNITAGGKTDTEAGSGGEGPMTRYFKTVAQKAADTSAQNLMESMKEAINYITDPSGAGGYHFQAFNNDGKLVADYWTDNPDLTRATNILMITKNGIAATNAGLTGTWKTAIDGRGVINAAQILTGTLTAIMIQSANYTSSTGSRLDLSDGTFSFAGGKLTYDGTALAVQGKVTVTDTDTDSKAILNEARLKFYQNSDYIGFVGTQKDKSNNRGIVFDMTAACDYMSWGAQDTGASQGSDYKQKFTWYRGVGFNFHDNIDMHNYDISNVDIVNSSDRRLKENIKDSEVSASDVIRAIKPREFDWKADGEHCELGFIADELGAVKDKFAATMSDGTQGIKLLELVPYLVKAYQELDERVSRLERNS